MIAILILALLISLIIFCIVIIKKNLCSNLAWFKAGLGVSSWSLFVYIMVQAIVFVSHNGDFKEVKRHTSELRNFTEQTERNKSILSFVLSKKGEFSKSEIETIESADKFFKDYPNLKTDDVEKVLVAFLEAKTGKEEMGKKLLARKLSIKERSASSWVLILPKNKYY